MFSSISEVEGNAAIGEDEAFGWAISGDAEALGAATSGDAEAFCRRIRPPPDALSPLAAETNPATKSPTRIPTRPRTMVFEIYD
jgi:hypothetical protein